jgi:hypothetical protein
MSVLNMEDKTRHPGQPMADRLSTDSINRAVSELRFITGRLRIFGTVTLVATVINIGILFWAVYLVARPKYFIETRSFEGGSSLIVVSIIIPMATIILLSLHETLRKRGDALFQELSDELQWHVGRRLESDMPRERPLLAARVSLRAFSAASELPLVPGRFGGAVYAGLNLTLAVTSVLLIRT